MHLKSTGRPRPKCPAHQSPHTTLALPIRNPNPSRHSLVHTRHHQPLLPCSSPRLHDLLPPFLVLLPTSDPTAARGLLNLVSFTASGSHILAVVGPSGAGKSMLLRILSGRGTSIEITKAPTVSINGHAITYSPLPNRIPWFLPIFSPSTERWVAGKAGKKSSGWRPSPSSSSTERRAAANPSPYPLLSGRRRPIPIPISTEWQAANP